MKSFHLLFIALLIIFSSCVTETKNKVIERKIIKKAIVSTYSIVIINGIAVKDSLVNQTEKGFLKNGVISYLLPLIGEYKMDTVKVIDHIVTSEKIDNITFYYADGEIQYIEKVVGDTTFKYNSIKDESPITYVIKEQYGNAIEVRIYEDYYRRLIQYSEFQYNSNFDVVYYVSTSNYFPSELELKYDTELEIAKKKMENKKVEIIETEYEYY